MGKDDLKILLNSSGVKGEIIEKLLIKLLIPTRNVEFCTKIQKTIFQEVLNEISFSRFLEQVDSKNLATSPPTNREDQSTLRVDDFRLKDRV
jgi:hypothetical protein